MYGRMWAGDLRILVSWGSKKSAMVTAKTTSPAAMRHLASVAPEQGPQPAGPGPVPEQADLVGEDAQAQV